ncbi:hypothetical protein CKO27_21410 [Thiocystis violacea]|nr:hypothetical protein [Thiocystis violacea]
MAPRVGSWVWPLSAYHHRQPFSCVSAGWAYLSAIRVGADKLNVLFIAVDDLRPEIGIYGVDDIGTPNIDELAREGTRFTRAYSQMATCSPSRTSLLTGLRPDTTRITDLTTHFRNTIPSVVTLPQWFKQNGYVTRAICKIYHEKLNDALSWSAPLQEGFGVGAPNGPDGKPVAFAAIDKADSEFGDYKCASHAIQAMKDLRNTPFFIAVGFRKPHLPFVAPRKYFDMYDRMAIPEAINPYKAWGAPSVAFDNTGELRAYSQMPWGGNYNETLRRNLKHGYYAATSFMDAQVGRLLTELENSGLSQNTLVVFLGDHGFHLGEQADWGKHMNFEVATRVPLIFKGPGIPRNASSSALVELVDLYPTISQLAGLSIPSTQQHGGYPMQGDSLVSLIQNPTAKSPRGAFSQWPRSGYVGKSLRTDRYRYTEWSKTGSKLHELYDHSEDPSETTNLASDYRYTTLLPTLGTALAAGGKSDLPSSLR